MISSNENHKETYTWLQDAWPGGVGSEDDPEVADAVRHTGEHDLFHHHDEFGSLFDWRPELTPNDTSPTTGELAAYDARQQPDGHDLSVRSDADLWDEEGRMLPPPTNEADLAAAALADAWIKQQTAESDDSQDKQTTHQLDGHLDTNVA